MLGDQAEHIDTGELLGLETSVGPWNIRSAFAVTGSIPPGPYFLHGNAIHQAWRLYPDTLEAFSVAAYPQNVKTAENVTFTPLHFFDKEGIWKNVAVPSRLYSVPTIEKPLAGKRILVKDNY